MESIASKVLSRRHIFRVCRNMLNEIISRSQAGTLGSNFHLGSSGLIGPGIGGGMGDGSEKSVEISIPPDKCGLIIGKGGETIKTVSCY